MAKWAVSWFNTSALRLEGLARASAGLISVLHVAAVQNAHFPLDFSPASAMAATSLSLFIFLPASEFLPAALYLPAAEFLPVALKLFLALTAELFLMGQALTS